MKIIKAILTLSLLISISLQAMDAGNDFNSVLSLSRPQFENTLRANPALIDATAQDGKNLLQLAIEQKRLSNIKTLLAKKANPWKEDKQGLCAFNSAVNTNDLAIMRALLKTHADDQRYKDLISIPDDKLANPDKYQRSLNKQARSLGFRGMAKLLRYYHELNDPLFKAVMLGDKKRIAEILKQDPIRKSSALFSQPLREFTSVGWAAVLGDEELARHLHNDHKVEKGDVHLYIDEYMELPMNVRKFLEEELSLEIFPTHLNQVKLFEFMRQNNLQKLNELLAQYTLIDHRSGIFHTTPLEHAVGEKNRDLVEALKNHNADFDNPIFDRPLLLTACLNDDIEMIKLLVRCHKSKKTAVNFNQSKKYWPFKYNLSPQVRDELFNLFDVYLFKGQDVQTVLSNSTRLSRVELIDRALSKGADINGYDSKGNTALHWACTIGDPDVISFLLTKGAKPNLVDQKKERCGLRWLLRMHKTSVEKNGRQITTSEILPCFFLLSCSGANPRVKDKYKEDVFDWMKKQKFSDLERHLVESCLLAKYKSKDERKALLDRIFDFQLKEIEKYRTLNNNDSINDINKIQEALVKKDLVATASQEFKDIYKKHIE